MLASTIWASVSASWAALTPFTVARVPTGMNRGVVTTPWGVWKQPQRARLRGLRAEISKRNGAGPSEPLAADSACAMGSLEGTDSPGQGASPPEVAERVLGGLDSPVDGPALDEGPALGAADSIDGWESLPEIGGWIGPLELKGAC